MSQFYWAFGFPQVEVLTAVGLVFTIVREISDLPKD
jgi:hypothetical protein